MDWEQRCIQLCAAVLVCAVVLRLWSGGALAPVGRALEGPEAASFFVYLQTGRVVRTLPAAVETTQPSEPTEPEGVRFSAEDAAYIELEDPVGIDPDVDALLTEPLDWDLTGEGPKVLILHTHATESFTQTQLRYEETSAYRTLDPEHNMLAVGELVTELLEEAGIGVLHDTTLHDYPSYNSAYTHAASSIRDYLERYPTIELVLDLHRDAADTPTGQLVTTCSVGGETAAQLMFVVGTDTRLTHPDWERNLSLALKLQALLERENPGICRAMELSKNRYNQHLGDRALLIEVGAAGNTLDQALLAARELVEAIIALANTE